MATYSASAASGSFSGFLKGLTGFRIAFTSLAAAYRTQALAARLYAKSDLELGAMGLTRDAIPALLVNELTNA